MKPEQELEAYRAWGALFIDENNNLRPEGETILRDLEKVCGWLSKQLPLDGNNAVDPLRLAADSAKRTVFVHIKGRLAGPPSRLKRLTETSNE